MRPWVNTLRQYRQLVISLYQEMLTSVYCILYICSGLFNLQIDEDWEYSYRIQTDDRAHFHNAMKTAEQLYNILILYHYVYMSDCISPIQ